MHSYSLYSYLKTKALKKLLFTCCIFINLLTPHVFLGQLIHGRIIDRISKQPLIYASIQLGLRGVISSHEGYFKISIKPADLQKNNKLKISFLGYKSQNLNLNDVKDNLIIELETKENQLDEVKITNGAEEIIKQAIQNFKLNYANKPYAMYGIQSEDLEDQNQKKIYHLRADLKAIMPKFSSREKIKIELTNLFLIEFKKADSSNFFIWGATGRAIEFFDFLNNSYSVLDSTKFKRFRFIVEESVFENRPVYKISFSPKKNPDTQNNSYLIMEKGTYAIITLQIEAANTSSFWAILHHSKLQINYQKFDKKWYFKSLYHTHESRRWTSKKDEFERLNLEVQIDKIDTLVNFDIQYSSNIQKDDILYLKASNESKKIDSLKYHNTDPSVTKQKNRFVKFWYTNVSIGKMISNTPLNSSTNSLEIRFQEDELKFDNSYMIKKKAVNPILLGVSVEIKVGKAIKLQYEASSNFGIGGRRITNAGIGMKFQKIIHPNKRPFGLYVSPLVRLIHEKIPIPGLQTFTSLQYDLMKLKEEPVQLVFNKVVPLLSIALGYSYEISRKKHLNFEIQYNYANKVANYLSIDVPKASIFLSRSHILTSAISNHHLNNINFSIKLF